MEKGVLELNESSVIVDDVEKRIRTAGVKGLDFNKAKELGFFQRISNLLCASHASIMAAYRIYGGAATMLNDFGSRKNEIALAMNNFERAYMKFVDFWTTYYAHGDSGKEVNEETEMLYRRIMEWAELPFEWNLGDKQKVAEKDITSAICIDDQGKQYTFHTTVLNEKMLEDPEESWCVTKYDVKEHKQVAVEEGMDKASAVMVAKRLSSEDKDNIYTASLVSNNVVQNTTVTPFKAYRNNNVIGSIVRKFKS